MNARRTGADLHDREQMVTAWCGHSAPIELDQDNNPQAPARCPSCVGRLMANIIQRKESTMRSYRDAPDYLFTLRVKPFRVGETITIRAFDANRTDSTGHSRIDVEVREGSSVIFPRGALYCGVPCGTTVDGVDARELVLSLVAMKPGDTDSEYFADYTEEQLAFAHEYGEVLDLARYDRYCDETGAVKRGMS